MRPPHALPAAHFERSHMPATYETMHYGYTPVIQEIPTGPGPSCSFGRFQVVAVKRLALERVAFDLVWSHLVVHGQLRRRGRGPRLESGFGEQRFCSSHLVACAAHSQ